MNNPPSASPLDPHCWCFYDINRRPRGNSLTARSLSVCFHRGLLSAWLTVCRHGASVCSHTLGSVQSQWQESLRKLAPEPADQGHSGTLLLMEGWIKVVESTFLSSIKPPLPSSLSTSLVLRDDAVLREHSHCSLVHLHQEFGQLDEISSFFLNPNNFQKASIYTAQSCSVCQCDRIGGILK